MLTNDVSSDIEKIIKTQPVVVSPPGDDYVGRGELPGKLSAFEKLIRHAISRFSMDRVYDLLRIVTTELRTQTAAQEAAAAAAALAEAAATKEEDEETIDHHGNDSEKGKADGSENEDGSEGASEKDVDNKSVKSDKSNKSSDRASVKSSKSSDSSNEKTEHVSSKAKQVTKTVNITSLKQVREIIKGLEVIEAGGGKLTDRQIVALRHYATFAKDVAYLRESKTYFYDNVYQSLLQDFYDPNEPTESQSSDSPTDNDKNNTSTDSSTVAGTRKNKKVKNSNRLPKTNQRKPEATKENNRKRIQNVVSELEETMSKWTGLLEEDDQKLEYFDQDSHHEVVHYLHSAPFELVFRVVPDVFIKCYRALDLSREWIKIAEMIYKGRLPLRRKITQDEDVTAPADAEEQKEDTRETEEAERKMREATTKTYNNHMAKIKARIVNVTELLQSHDNQMTELTKEMQTLKAREDRVDKLNANFEKADSKLQTAQKEFSKYLNERQKTIDEIAGIPPGSLQHSELSKRAETLDKELTKRQIELGLLEYQKSVVQEDFLLELELRPNFIHFVGDVEGKIADIKTDAKQKKTEKEKLEKQLTSMMSNTDKVKAVMAEYLGREPNDADMEIAVRLAGAGEADDQDGEEEESKKNGEISDDDETDYWQKETKNYDSDGSVGLESDQSFVSVSDDVDLTEFLPSNVVFGEVSTADRKMAGKARGYKGTPKRKTLVPQSSQQFSDAMRVLSPNNNSSSQRVYSGPKKLKPHSKVYKQMHGTNYRPS
ncbi:enolase-phosphatase E1-like isoform X1 [Argopecten irradians]|uniref:enolase-phosphatase E1-like isoform X1 n=1 Tax=Argopecten irradians TaxID=31199 RepID=UPI003717FAF7